MKLAGSVVPFGNILTFDVVLRVEFEVLDIWVTDVVKFHTPYMFPDGPDAVSVETMLPMVYSRELPDTGYIRRLNVLLLADELIMKFMDAVKGGFRPVL